VATTGVRDISSHNNHYNVEELEVVTQDDLETGGTGSHKSKKMDGSNQASNNFSNELLRTVAPPRKNQPN